MLVRLHLQHIAGENTVRLISEPLDISCHHDESVIENKWFMIAQNILRPNHNALESDEECMTVCLYDDDIVICHDRLLWSGPKHFG